MAKEIAQPRIGRAIDKQEGFHHCLLRRAVQVRSLGHGCGPRRAGCPAFAGVVERQVRGHVVAPSCQFAVHLYRDSTREERLAGQFQAELGDVRCLDRDQRVRGPGFDIRIPADDAHALDHCPVTAIGLAEVGSTETDVARPGVAALGLQEAHLVRVVDTGQTVFVTPPVRSIRDFLVCVLVAQLFQPFSEGAAVDGRHVVVVAAMEDEEWQVECVHNHRRHVVRSHCHVADCDLGRVVENGGSLQEHRGVKLDVRPACFGCGCGEPVSVGQADVPGSMPAHRVAREQHPVAVYRQSRRHAV